MGMGLWRSSPDRSVSGGRRALAQRLAQRPQLSRDPMRPWTEAVASRAAALEQPSAAAPPDSGLPGAGRCGDPRVPGSALMAMPSIRTVKDDAAPAGDDCRRRLELLGDGPAEDPGALARRGQARRGFAASSSRCSVSACACAIRPCHSWTGENESGQRRRHHLRAKKQPSQRQR